MKLNRNFLRAFFVFGLFLFLAVWRPQVSASQTSFKRIPLQCIAALGDPDAASGNNAQQWGIWRLDPGPRGMMLSGFEGLKVTGGVTPKGWKFDSFDWWLEEHGLIMEKPVFPLPAGKYVVTGGREVTSILTVFPKDENGAQKWELARGAKLYDVTHLPCRSARYRPALGDGVCTPAKAKQNDFPVTPGIAMPEIDGCVKQDYAVLFVIGLES